MNRLKQVVPEQISLGSVSLTWFGHIKIDNLSFQEKPDSKPIIRIKTLDIDIKLTALFKKKLLIQGLELVEPEISINQYSEAKSNWLSLTKSSFLFISELTIKNGSLKYKDLSGKSLELKKVDIHAWHDDISSPVRYKTAFEIVDYAKPATIKSEGEIALFKDGQFDIKNLSAQCKLSFEELDIFGQLKQDFFKSPFSPDIKRAKGGLSINYDTSGNIKGLGKIDIESIVFKEKTLQKAETSFQELFLDFDFSYATSKKRLGFKRFTAKTKGVSLTLTGAVNRLGKKPFINLKPSIEYTAGHFEHNSSRFYLRGSTLSNLHLKGNIDNLLIKGTTYLSSAQFFHKDTLIKEQGEKTIVDYHLNVKGKDLIVEDIALSSDSYKAKAKGTIFDFKKSQELSLHILLDGDSAKILHKTGEHKFIIKGPFKNSAFIKGNRKDLEVKGSLNLSDTEISYDKNTIKPPEEEMRLNYDARFLDNVFFISKIDILSPDETVQIKGKITPDKGNIIFESARFRLKKKERDILIDGTIAYAPGKISTQNLHLSINENRWILSAAIRDFLSKQVVQFDLKGKEIYFKDFSGVNTLPFPIEKILNRVHRKKFPYLSAAVISCRLYIKNLHLENYHLGDVTARMHYEDGIYSIKELQFGFNKGAVLINSLINTNGKQSKLKFSMDMKNIEAGKNLRPIVNEVFPQLHISKKVDSKIVFTGYGRNREEIIKTLHGNSRTTITEGYIKGRPAPPYLTVLFPVLRSSEYYFKTGKITSNMKNGRLYTNMTFRGGNFDFYVFGTEDILKNEVDYTFGVDLISSFRLNVARKTIPESISKNTNVDIAYIKGNENNPTVYYLQPNATLINESLKKLFNLTEVTSIFAVNQEAKEKARLFQGGMGKLLKTTFIKPFQFLKEKGSRALER